MIPKTVHYVAYSGRGPIRRVLVVDDVPEIGDFYRALFRRLTRVQVDPVIEVKSRDAIARMETERFDLIITDFRMPDGTGDNVIAAARRSQPQIPIVLMSGYLPVGARSGLAASLAKPLKADMVLRLIESLLDPTVEPGVCVVGGVAARCAPADAPNGGEAHVK